MAGMHLLGGQGKETLKVRQSVACLPAGRDSTYTRKRLLVGSVTPSQLKEGKTICPTASRTLRPDNRGDVL